MMPIKNRSAIHNRLSFQIPNLTTLKSVSAAADLVCL